MAAALVSCKKNDSTSPTQQSPTNLVKTIIYESQPPRTPVYSDTCSFFYDNQQRCIKRIFHTSGNVWEYSYVNNIITEISTNYDMGNKSKTVYYIKHGFFPDSVIATGYTLTGIETGKSIIRYEYNTAGDLLMAKYSDYYVDTVNYIDEYRFSNGNPDTMFRYATPKGITAIWGTVFHFNLSKPNNITPYPWPVITGGANLQTGYESSYDWGGGPSSATHYGYTFDSLGRVLTQFDSGASLRSTYTYY
ncbi:hypothetical protein ACTHGU_03040 [Chitinophagaceae bacterium MMS25-I14]